MTYPDPTLNELNAIRMVGNEAGADLRVQAGECPYTPRDTMRHRSWMDGFSEGRVAARSAIVPALSAS
jgi:hypothetical protein